MTPPEGRIDLHAHSRHSDGMLAPDALIAEAARRGVSILALTDHDTVAGLPAARAAADAAGIRLVPGIEMSTHEKGKDFHILGYFLDDARPELRILLTRLGELRRARILDILDALGREGIHIAPDEVYAEAAGGSVGRPHVARVLIRRGHVTTMSQAFRKYLGPGATAYAKAHDLSPAEGIAALRAAGAVTSLAHPAFLEDDALIPPLVGHGLQAVEAWHSHPSGDVSGRYLPLAEKLGILVTAGSDFHDPEGGSAPLGTIHLAPEHFERLEAARQS